MNDTNDDNITFDDILLERDEAPASAPAARPIQRADEILARLALEDALDGPTRRRIKRGGTLAMVIAVPTAAWVEPMHVAASTLTSWDGIIIRNGTDHRQHQADRGNDDVAARLTCGGRVLGIAPNPHRHLPAALTATADVQITIRPPSPAMLRRVIRAVTGKAPRWVPPSLGAGLDVTDISAAIRAGATAGASVRRLEAAKRARTMVDPALAEVPTLDRLHGYGEAMVWSKALVRDLELWRQGKIAFSAIDRCAVFASDPGMGKSTLVRSIAKTANIHFFPTTVSAWFGGGAGYLDSLVKQIDSLFANASAVAPSLVFIDEIEAVPDRRRLHDRDKAWWTTLVGHLLAILDSSTSGVSSKLVVIGATNYPDRLDPALVRPGRLSKIITITPPDAAALAAILHQHLDGDLAGHDLMPLARVAAGASGAQAAAWVRGARGRARAAGRPVTWEDLRAEVCPPDRRSPEDVRRCAVHEAGHAAITRLTGVGTVAEISVVDRDGGGHMSATTAADTTLTRADVEKMVIAILGGRAAEEVVFGAATSGSGGSPRSDLALATQLVASTHASMGLGDGLVYRAAPEAATSLLSFDPDLRRTVEADIARLYACALGLVREHRRLVESLADVLVADKVVLGTDFERLFSAYAWAVTTRSPRRRGGRHG